MDCPISQKVVAFLQDKNKHCNLAEWAVWYNFINLNGACGLRERERIHGHFTVHKLEQFNLKTTCRRLEDSVTALVGECLSFLSELTLYFTFQLLGFVYC